jgi:hypothetical protein
VPRLRLTRIVTLFGGLATICLLVATSAQATHARPKGASPMYLSLVPAYAACAAPNHTHGPPLAFASCKPPAQTSAQATVGTPDAFGGAANSVSHLRLSYILGPPTAEGDADVLVDMALNDVRCAPAGAHCGAANTSGPADYSGDLGFAFAARTTDHYNASAPGGGTDAATVQDLTVEYKHTSLYPGPCVQTGSTSTGSTCNLATSLNAVIPGSVKDSKRAVWELDGVRIFDGGADGNGDTTADNTVFARPGIFIP